MANTSSDQTTDRKLYWESVYSAMSSDRVPPPSQFAAFVAQEAADCGLIIEFGCGSGRDSLFFARQGLPVIAFDSSQNAIDKCRENAVRHDVAGAEFVRGVVGDGELERIVENCIPSQRNFQLMIYARFFLHAITEEEENAFLDLIRRVTGPGDLLAFEFRTIRDASLAKATPGHFRRFLEPAKLHAKISGADFSVDYAVEGFGFAKFKQDDAYVARCVFRKHG